MMLLVVLLAPDLARAQVPNLLELGAQYMPSAKLADPLAAEAQVSSYDAAFNVPIPLDKSTFPRSPVGHKRMRHESHESHYG